MFRKNTVFSCNVIHNFTGRVKLVNGEHATDNE